MANLSPYSHHVDASYVYGHPDFFEFWVNHSKLSHTVQSNWDIGSVETDIRCEILSRLLGPQDQEA